MNAPLQSATCVVSASAYVTLSNRRWTAQDDRRLRRLWSKFAALDTIALALGRTERAVYARAGELDLLGKTPSGFERLHHAVQRTGFAWPHLRRLLAAYGVVVERSARRAPGHTKRGQTLVRIADVDRAIHDWMRREPLMTAARRLGVPIWVLRNRLKAIGIEKPIDLPRKVRWRVSDDEVQRAMSGYEPRRAA